MTKKIIMELVEVSCYNCGGKEYELYATENGFRYVKCKNCGLVYLNPRPKDVEVISSHEYGVHIGNKVINVTGRYKKSKIKRYLSIIGDFYTKEELIDKKWLDIGCGFGEFIETLNKVANNNIYVKGSELNKIKINFCKERGLDVEKIDMKNHNEKYDVISLLNIFSHLPNPIQYFESLKKNLRTRGELFIETGNISNMPAKYFPRPFYAPDHLSFANKEIVEDILKRIGFEIVKTKLYRGELYPKISDIRGSVVLAAKSVVKYKDGRFRNFFPKYPNIDMFIRAKLK